MRDPLAEAANLPGYGVCPVCDVGIVLAVVDYITPSIGIAPAVWLDETPIAGGEFALFRSDEYNGYIAKRYASDMPLHRIHDCRRAEGR